MISSSYVGRVGLLLSFYQAESTQSTPLLVVTEGCSGSSYFRNVLLRLLSAAGIETLTENHMKPYVNWEVFHQDKNPFFKRSEGTEKPTIGMAVKQLAQAATKDNSTLL